MIYNASLKIELIGRLPLELKLDWVKEWQKYRSTQPVGSLKILVQQHKLRLAEDGFMNIYDRTELNSECRAPTK